jgi:TonB family protein
MAAGVAFAAALSAQTPTRTATPVPRLSGGFGRPRATALPTTASEAGGQAMSDVVHAAHETREGQPPDKTGVTITDRSLVKSSETGRVSTSNPVAAQSRPASGSPPSVEEVAAGAGRSGAGSARIGSLTLDEADFRYPAYIGRLVQIISLNWFKPAATVQTSPVVHFEIQKDGTITNPRIVRSSGVVFVDRAAIRAVIASSPLPGLPAEYGLPHLGIQVIFE